MFNYIRSIVAAAFRVKHPDNLQPTEQQLRNFDNFLFTTYDGEINAQAAAAGISLDPFASSTLAFYADQSTKTTAAHRVADACTFYLAAHPHP